MHHKQENCLDTCFLRLMFLPRGLFLLLLQQSVFKILFNFHRVSLGCLSYSKKRKINQNNHSLSLVVICCHSLSLVFTRFHSSSLVVSRCTTPCHLMYHSSFFLETIYKACYQRQAHRNRGGWGGLQHPPPPDFC